MKVREKLRRAAHRLQRVARVVRNGPRWFVLRLATRTGISAGWWIMAICSAVVGAVAAVAVVTVVHWSLRSRSALPVASREANETVARDRGPESQDGD